jgi:hypothetical protein
MKLFYTNKVVFPTEDNFGKAGVPDFAALARALNRPGIEILRYGLVIVLLWIGGMKFTGYEAAGIAPLEIHSPLMNWVYYLLGERVLSNLLGVVEIALGLGDRTTVRSPARLRNSQPALSGDVPDYLEFSLYDPGMGAHPGRVPRTLGVTRPIFVEGYRASRRSGFYRQRSIRRGPRTETRVEHTVTAASPKG